MTLLFLDVETTGVTNRDTILEIAWFVTNDDGSQRREEHSQVIGVTGHGRARIIDNPHVHALHRRSGLFDELGDIGDEVYDHTLENVRRKLRQLHQREGGRALQLSGFSVHFDARMLLAAWRASDWSSATGGGYRYLDVSSVTRAVLEATGIDVRPATEVAHRALADCDAAHQTYLAALATIAGR
jgi:oligoribonuclease (3'-5' exoribonuclease)